METKAGIDYGLGKTNRDEKTGIRFGVISQNEVMQTWSEESNPWYGNGSDCPECGETIDISDEFPDSCPHCDTDLSNSWDDMEPITFTFNDKEYVAESDSYGDIMITKSPYYTICKFCSPCAPGAGYIMDSVTDGIRAYCFGHDWFDADEQAPYPVYSVETGKLIEPIKNSVNGYTI